MDAVRESLAQQLNELRAENERLREALRDLLNTYSDMINVPPHQIISGVGMKARAALTSQGSK